MTDNFSSLKPKHIMMKNNNCTEKKNKSMDPHKEFCIPVFIHVYMS